MTLSSLLDAGTRPGIGDLHWCLGMYASGSTWLFNAVIDVARVLDSHRRVESGYVGFTGPPPEPPDTNAIAVIKTHEVDAPTLQGLQKHARAIWLSIRDPRDCVASLMEYQEQSFSEACDNILATASACELFADDPRSILFRYEDGFIDDPATLDKIALGFGGSLSVADQASIFVASRRSAIEAFINEIPSLTTAVWPDPGHVVDSVTQWHNHHANRTGEIGRWTRHLTSEQAINVECRLGDWFDRFRYRRSGGARASKALVRRTVTEVLQPGPGRLPGNSSP